MANEKITLIEEKGIKGFLSTQEKTYNILVDCLEELKKLNEK